MIKPIQGHDKHPAKSGIESNPLNQPVFAIVGHPNKGKSSLVATLTQNDSVAISRLSGTTTQSEEFRMEVDGQVCYRIIDTPGFQRARPLLQHLTKKSAHAGDRLQALKSLMAEADFAQRYPDEQQLLQPIVNGAAIIYLVDGAKPYRPEYESEMQILQWTGQPRLAVINPINGSQYIEQWQQALDQFFSRVLVFSPLDSPFQESMQLLKAFSQIRQQWEEPVSMAVKALISDREHRISLAIEQICQSCINILCYQVTLDDKESDDILEHFQSHLRTLESESMQKVEALLRYYQISRYEELLQLRHSDLMDSNSWSHWGLDRKELMLMAAGGGAASGAAIDVGLGGASLFAGAVIGSIAATGTALVYSSESIRQKFKQWLPASSSGFVKQSTMGPVNNPMFAWALLGRSIYHLDLILQRTHAQRMSLSMEGSSGFDLKKRLTMLPASDTRALASWLNSKGKMSKMASQSAKIQRIIMKCL